MFLKQRTSNESMNDLSLFSKRIWAIMKKWEGEVKINFTQIGCWVRWLLPVCFCDCIVSGSFQKSAKNVMYPNLPQSPSSERIVQNFYIFFKNNKFYLPDCLTNWKKIKTWSLKKQNILMFSVFWTEGFHKKFSQNIISVVVERGSSLFCSTQIQMSIGHWKIPPHSM